LRSSTANAQPNALEDDETTRARTCSARALRGRRFKGTTDGADGDKGVGGLGALEAEVTLNVTERPLLDKHKKMNTAPPGVQALSEKLESRRP
jgi:hypothetical protein